MNPKTLLPLTLSVVILISAVIAVIGQSASALTFQDYTYTENPDGTVTITEYTGASKDVTIPATINGRNVSTIGANAFKGKGLTAVTTPETIDTIGTGAFADNKLVSLTVGKSNSHQPVQTHGALKTSGKHLVDQHNNIVQLNGVSLFHSNWGKYFTKGTVDRLVSDFQVSLIRIPMNVEATSATPANQGYLQNPEANYNRVKTVVDAAIANGVYVVIDWHDHHAEDHETQAKDFFNRISSEYKNVPNVLYEVYNEPQDSTWPQIKSYAEAVIPSIRANSPDALVIVGTPQYSMRVDQAAANPITAFNNIAYTLHFYADGPNQNYVRGLAQTAYDANIALFVTEWGVGDYSGAGTFNQAETTTWLNWLRQRNISSAMWSVGDKAEVTAMLYGTASGAGTWGDSQITPTGHFIRDQLRTTNATTLAEGAFYNNDLTSITFRGHVRGTTQAFQADSYSDSEVARINTPGNQNVYRYTETDNTTLVNAAFITIQVVDENNQAVTSYIITGENSDSYAKTNDYSKYYRTGQKVTVQPKTIEGRATPDAQEVVLVSGENSITLTYKTLPGVPNTGSMSLQPAIIVPIVVLVIGAAAITIRKFL